MCEEERAPCLNGGAVGTPLGLFSGHGVHSQLCGGCAFEGKASRWGKILEQWLSTRDDFFFAFYETFSVVPSGKMGDQGCS